MVKDVVDGTCYRADKLLEVQLSSHTHFQSAFLCCIVLDWIGVYEPRCLIAQEKMDDLRKDVALSADKRVC